jgi:hypothetical protein
MLSHKPSSCKTYRVFLKQTTIRYVRVLRTKTKKKLHTKGFFILYCGQQLHNYFTNSHTPTCFDTIVSSSDSLQSTPCQVTPVLQMQLSVIQFTIKMFHIGFMSVLILQSLKSQYFKIFKTQKLSYLQ